MICCPGTAVKLAPSPETYVNTPPVPLTLPAPTLPVTVNAVNVPTDVIFACAAPVTVAAVPVAEPAEPVIEPEIGAVTDNPDNVPTDVIAVCAAVPNVPLRVVAVTVVADKVSVSLSNVNVESAPKSHIIKDNLSV